MSLTLYDAVIPPFQQMIGSVQGVLEKGAQHYEARGLRPDELLSAKIHETMLALPFQLNSVMHHSIGAIKGIEAGEFNANSGLETTDYAGFQASLVNVAAELAALTPEKVNALSGKDVMFKFAETQMPFTAEGFLFSFSKPNVYFHAATAYDILRMQNVPLGKRDFLGQIQLKK